MWETRTYLKKYKPQSRFCRIASLRKSSTSSPTNLVLWAQMQFWCGPRLWVSGQFQEIQSPPIGGAIHMSHLYPFIPSPRAWWAIWATKWVRRHENCKHFRAFGGGGAGQSFYSKHLAGCAKVGGFSGCGPKRHFEFLGVFVLHEARRMLWQCLIRLSSFSLCISMFIVWQESSWTRSAAIGGQESPWTLWFRESTIFIFFWRTSFGAWRAEVRQTERTVFAWRRMKRDDLHQSIDIQINTKYIKIQQNIATCINLSPFFLIWPPTSFGLLTCPVYGQFLPLFFSSVTYWHVFLRQLNFNWWHVVAN